MTIATASAIAIIMGKKTSVATHQQKPQKQPDI